jgi:hypothetical protein
VDRTTPSNEHGWAPLYRVTAWALAAMVVIIVVQIAIYVAWPPPTTAAGFLELLVADPVLGLLSLDLLYLVQNLILAVLYVALFARLRADAPTLSTLGLVSGLLGVAAYIPSNPAFELLDLATVHASAGAEGRAAALAAAEALVAGYTGTAFLVYYVLSGIALLLFAVAILRTAHFSRASGWWGLAAGVLMVVPSPAGVVGMVFALASLVPWTVFVVLLALRFRRLAAGDPALR